MVKIEGEKYLEKKLKDDIKKIGGWSLKLLATHITGLPDRLCLLPQGRLFFAEIKTTKKTPSPMQRLVHRKLRKLGFKVFIIDTSEQISNIIKEYDNSIHSTPDRR